MKPWGKASLNIIGLLIYCLNLHTEKWLGIFKIFSMKKNYVDHRCGKRNLSYALNLLSTFPICETNFPKKHMKYRSYSTLRKEKYFLENV